MVTFVDLLKRVKKILFFEPIVLIIIFLFAFSIRYIGLKFSYPLVTLPDEVAILSPVYSMTANQTLNPNYFIRPDQFLFTINYIILNIISFLKTGQNFAVTFFSSNITHYLYFFYSRIIIAIFGALIPIVVYKIGKEGKINFSLPAALIFLVFPVFVKHSHFITPDIPITLFSLLVILFSIRSIKHKNEKDLLFATFFAAINTIEKYPGLISFSLIIISIIWINLSANKSINSLKIKQIVLEIMKYFLLYVFLLYVLAPNIFIQYGRTISGIKIAAEPTHLGADGLNWFGNMNFYARNFVSYATFIIPIFLIVGIYGVCKTKDYYLLLCFYGFIYFILLSKLSLHWERWGLPMYTFPLLISAFGFSYLLKVFHKNKTFKIFFLFVFGFTVIYLLLNSLSISVKMTYADTLVPALEYTKVNGITKDNSVYDGYSPFIPAGVSVYSPGLINKETKFIILSSKIYDRYFAEPARYSTKIKQYNDVRKKYILIKEFSPTFPKSTIGLISWIDDVQYYFRKFFGQKLPERYSGYTIQIYEIPRKTK